MIKNYFKVAYRNLLKHKGYSAINVLGLAVGVAVCVLIFSFVTHELSYDTYHAKSDRIYRVTTQTSQRNLALTASVISPVSQKNFPEVQEGVRILASGNTNPVVLRNGDKVFKESGIGYADSSFLDVFSFKVLAGNPKTALARPNTMIISNSMAQKYFGNKNPIGETLLMNNEQEYEITAIIKQIPANSHFRFDFIASMITLQGWAQLSDQELYGQQFYTYLVLQKDASPVELEGKINAYMNRNFPTDNDQLHLQPLTDIHLYSDLSYEIQPQSDYRYVIAASAIALLIIIIACINYMNLATARSVQRSREVGIRKVLGSDRKQLMGQFYGESALLVGLALILAVLLVESLMPWFNQLTAQSLNINYTNPAFWLLIGLIGIVVTVLAGSYPAFVLSGYKPVSVLKGSTNPRGNMNLRKMLVVFQFAVSIFLIISTLIIYQQVNYIQEKELGYQKEKVISIASYSEVENRFDTFRSELMQVPGIDNVTMASDTPVNIAAGFGIDVEGVEEDSNMVIRGLAIYPEFVQTLGIKIIAGRDLRQSDYSAANTDMGEPAFSFLLNKTAAHTLGFEPNEILGRRVNLSDRIGTVVGIVDDFHFASLHEDIEPLIMFPEPWFNNLMIAFSSENVQQTLDQTQKIWESMFPDYPFEYTFLDQEYDALYRQDVRTGNLFASFAILAVFVACLGLFGLASFMVEQRRKEIGVRKVLGATLANIVRLFSMDFIKLVLLGFILSVPVAWYIMNQWLHDFAYRIELGSGVFLLAGVAAFIIALLTVSWQSLKAALANPVDSLRNN